MFVKGEAIGRIKAIVTYFSHDSRKVEMEEIKALTQEDRQELADGIAAETGCLIVK